MQLTLSSLLGSGLPLLCLFALAEAAPNAHAPARRAAGPLTLHAPSSIPAAFQQVTASSSIVPLASSPYELTFHLRSPNLAGLESKMYSIADADGAWLTDEQLGAYITPSASDKAAVQSWLSKNNLSSYTWSPLGDRVTVQTNVGAAKNLLQAPLAQYSINGKRNVFRATSYTIPAEIAGSVEMVSPITSFIAPRSRASSPKSVNMTPAQVQAAANASPNGCTPNLVTPTCIRNFYGSANYTPVASNDQDLLIIGYDDQYFLQSDLDEYLSAFRPEAAGYAPTIEYLGSGVNQAPAGVETMLDVEMISGLIYPLKSGFLLVSGLQGDEILESLQHVLDTKPRPGVISISYGPDEQDVTPDQAAQYEKVAMQLTSLGTTVVFASGDNGVDGVQASENLKCKNGIKPPFPTTPSILLVGSTAGFSPEHATNSNDTGGFWSGAGWSNLYARPAYQTAAGKAYTSTVPKNELKYINATGRIISDVSAYGENLVIVENGLVVTVGGTSASSPIFTSHLALVNAARRQKGLGRIGFVHNKLYKSGKSSGALKDITAGTTCGCPDLPNLCFVCEDGFDPATGLGTPNLPKMLKLFNAV